MGEKFDDIADLIVPHDVLEFGGKRYRLLGLGLPEITFVVREHMNALAPLYEAAISGDVENNVLGLANQLAEEFGPIATSVIACAMRRVDARDKLRDLPFEAQVEALDKIIRLTVSDGGVGKLKEIAIRAGEAMAQMQKPNSQKR